MFDNPILIYHQIINIGINVALAVNWEGRSVSDMSEGYIFYSEHCHVKNSVTEQTWRYQEL